MFKHNAIALAVSSLSVLAGCSTVPVPERPALPERAGKIEPVMAVRNSGGVDSEGMYRIGRYFQGQMRYDAAVGAYRKALALDPLNVEARNALAVVYATQGLALESEREFKAAIVQSPSLSHLHSNLGYHYLQLGRTEEARSALREAIRLNPANAWAWSNLTTLERKALASSAPATIPATAASDAPAGVSAVSGPAEVATSAPLAQPAHTTAPLAPVVETAAPVTGGAEIAVAVTPAATAAPVPYATESLTPVALAPTTVAPVTPVASAGVSSAPAALETKSPASIVQTIETGPIAPTVQLVGLAPSVWELRPRVVQVAPPAAPIAPGRIAQADKAIPAHGIPAMLRFEISNGNGVTGLARRVGGYLRTLGMSAPRLTNQRPFNQRHTEIQYVPGMEDSARDLRTTLGTPADLVMTPRIERNAQMRVVLGKDFNEIEAVARMRSVSPKQMALAPGTVSR